MNTDNKYFNQILEGLDNMILHQRIFDLKMEELFDEPSTYEDELEEE